VENDKCGAPATVGSHVFIVVSFISRFGYKVQEGWNDDFGEAGETIGDNKHARTVMVSWQQKME
jgi:hypothetical protein